MRSVAKNVEAGVETGLRDGGPPLATVALCGFDGRGHAPIAERQQRLVVRMLSSPDNSCRRRLPFVSVIPGSSIGSR